jgi:hypothetical protein
MTETKKVGDCVQIDYSPTGGVGEMAPGYVARKAIDAAGCDTLDFSEEKEPFRAKACSVVREAIHTVTGHPVFKSVVSFLAKWQMGDYALRKGDKEVLGPEHGGDKSPAGVFNAYGKCLKK